MTGGPAVRHGFVISDGLRVHYLDFGGSGPPIVCLHGVTGHAWMWRGVAPAMAGLGRVIAVDMRGHGDSQWSGSEDYATEDHLRDLRQILDVLGAEPVVLVGLSWGGLVAIAMATVDPERVRRLAIVDVPPSFTQGEMEVMPRPYVFSTHEEAMAWEQEANPRAPEDMIEAMARFGTRPGEGGLVRKHDPFFLRRWPFRSDDRWSELDRLSQPTLLVHGEASFVLSGEVAGRMAERIPDVRLVHVPDSGHLVPVERPDALAEELTGFLDNRSR
jgi:pimeloyl-ACP methyl ester carboxylesterase